MMLEWLAARMNAARRRLDVPAPPAAPAPQPGAAPAAAPGPLALYRAGQLAEAAAAASQRLQAQSTDAESLQVQVLLALDRGAAKAALAQAQDLADARPPDADVLVLLGRAQAANGRRAAAQQCWERALQLQPAHPGALAEQGLLLLAAGKLEAAAALLARAGGGAPRLADAHLQLADRLRASHPERALQHIRAAVAAEPLHPVARANLGALLRERGEAQEAARQLQQALALRPGLPEAAFNLAMLRLDAAEWEQAAALLESYTAAQPKDGDGHYWLGNARMGQGDAAGARAAYAAALRCNARHVQARWGLAMAQLPAIAATREEQEAALDGFARELDKLQAWCRIHAAAGAHRAVGAQQPFYLAYVEADHRPVLQQYGTLCSSLMGAWARKAGIAAPAGPRTGGGRLRVGIVSAHIHHHSVWHALVRGWLEQLDPARFELHVFHTGSVRDEETARAARRASLRQGLGTWTAWGQAISEARLDALIYPELGMDATALRLAALRLARVQLASWGHPLTTGLPTIDGYLSAQAFEPADAARHYSEPLLALPGLGSVYQPYGTRPEPVDLAAFGVQRGDRVLLCPGVPFKYAPQDDHVLVEVARCCSPCKLVFFGRGSPHAARLEQRLRAAFAAAGEEFDRLACFIPWQPQPAFFGLLQRADVFLDTIGFSGFNTVMQAVECGTPIVAWEGRFMRGRFASAVLRELGLQEWIADTPAGYAERATRLCTDESARAAFSRQLRAARNALYGDRRSALALATHLDRLCAAGAAS